MKRPAGPFHPSWSGCRSAEWCLHKCWSSLLKLAGKRHARWQVSLPPQGTLRHSPEPVPSSLSSDNRFFFKCSKLTSPKKYQVNFFLNLAYSRHLLISGSPYLTWIGAYWGRPPLAPIIPTPRKAHGAWIWCKSS